MDPHRDHGGGRGGRGGRRARLPACQPLSKPSTPPIR